MSRDHDSSRDAAGKGVPTTGADQPDDARLRAIRDAQRAQALDAGDVGDPRDPGLAEEAVDQFDGPSFVDDVRSDGDEDERHDKR